MEILQRQSESESEEDDELKRDETEDVSAGIEEIQVEIPKEPLKVNLQVANSGNVQARLNNLAQPKSRA